MREEVREEAQLGWILVAPIKELLVESGFDVEGPAFLKGKSGANHMFDIVARDKSNARKATVIDVATSTEGVVIEQPVIALFAKIFDVSPDKAYLVAIPKMNDNGKKMAGLYNIQIVEAKSHKEARKAIKARMIETI
jgi:ATP-dependent Clp protease adapter protein ClpS